MPEIKKFKKMYRPLTPEQRQKSVDSAITKRIASFERMDQKHFRKLTKAAKEAKQFEAKKLRRRLKVIEESETAAEAEEKKTLDLIKVAEMEKADKEELLAEMKVAEKINPEAICTLAFKKLHADLQKIGTKERARLAKEAAKREEDESRIINEMQAAAGLPPLPAVKRERPDETEDLPKAKKSKKNKAAEAEAIKEEPTEVKEEEEAEDTEAVGPETPLTKGERAAEAKARKREIKAAAEAKAKVSQVKDYGQQLGVSKWAQQKIEANTILPTWEEQGPYRRFAEKVMKHAHFNDSFLQVKKIQLQTKAKLEKFKVLCAKHQLLAEQKALEEGLNPPPPKPKKGKKGQQGKKRVFVKMTEEEKKAAKKWKYNKNKDRNKQRKLEAEQARAAHQAAREAKASAALAAVKNEA